MSHHRENLNRLILYNSVEKNDIDKAIREWDVIPDYISFMHDCQCGQCNVSRLYAIQNRSNGRRLDEIGYICIKRFNNKELTEQVERIEKTVKRGDLKIRNKRMPKIDGQTYDWLCDNKQGWLYYREQNYPNEAQFTKYGSEVDPLPLKTGVTAALKSKTSRNCFDPNFGISS